MQFSVVPAYVAASNRGERVGVREARARYAPGARYAPPHVFRPTPVGPLEPGTQPAAKSETMYRITGAQEFFEIEKT